MAAVAAARLSTLMTPAVCFEVMHVKVMCQRWSELHSSFASLTSQGSTPARASSSACPGQQDVFLAADKQHVYGRSKF